MGFYSNVSIPRSHRQLSDFLRAYIELYTERKENFFAFQRLVKHGQKIQQRMAKIYYLL